MDKMDPNEMVDAEPKKAACSRNSACKKVLRKELEQFEKDKDLAMLGLIHDKLDTIDFFKQLKSCPSDELPEAKHWLGDKTPRRLDSRPQRLVLRGELGGDATRRDSGKTAPSSTASPFGKPTEKLEDGTVSLTKRFHSRLPHAGDLKGNLAERGHPGQDESLWRILFSSDKSDDLTLPRSRMGDRHLDNASGDTSVVVAAMNRPDSAPSIVGGTEVKSKFDQILDSQKAAAARKKKMRADVTPSSGQARKDFIRQLLVENARRRSRPEPRCPLEERIQEFFAKLGELKSAQRQNGEPDLEREWILFTRGGRGGLAQSDDNSETNSV